MAQHHDAKDVIPGRDTKSGFCAYVYVCECVCVCVCACVHARVYVCVLCVSVYVRACVYSVCEYVLCVCLLLRGEGGDFCKRIGNR